MAWRLNREGKQKALDMIKRGRVSDAPWDAREAEDKLLGDPPDWERYASWHLAYDPDADKETKAAYAYPFGDGENVFRRAVAAIKARATQNGEDEIRAAADDIWDAIEGTEKMIDSRRIKICATQLLNHDPEMRRITIVAATEDRDRAGDIIRMEGLEIDNYLKNPVVLAGHGTMGDLPIIGKALSVTKQAGKLIADIEFLPPGVNQIADRLFSIIKFVGTAAASVGILIKEWNPLPDNGIEIIKSELLEISLVPVPANQHALTTVKEEDIQHSEAILRSLNLAQELVQELAALVSTLIDKLPSAEGRKTIGIRIRRA
ncbi:MAG: hypothetical protein QXW98_04880 [Candidatus Caldarchaeum sp.]